MKTNTKRRLSAYLLLGLGLFICFTLLFTMGVFSLGRLAPAIFDREVIESADAAFPGWDGRDNNNNSHNNRRMNHDLSGNRSGNNNGSTNIPNAAPSSNALHVVNIDAGGTPGASWSNSTVRGGWTADMESDYKAVIAGNDKRAHAMLRFQYNITFTGDVLRAISSGKITNISVVTNGIWSGSISGSTGGGSRYEGWSEIYSNVSGTVTSRGTTTFTGSNTGARNSNTASFAAATNMTGIRLEYQSYQHATCNSGSAGGSRARVYANLTVNSVTITWTYSASTHTYGITTNGAAGGAGGSLTRTSLAVTLPSNGTTGMLANTASPNANYYFRDWSANITGATYISNASPTLTPSIAGEVSYNGRAITLTANFVSFTISGGSSYTFSGSAQGPTVTLPSGGGLPTGVAWSTSPYYQNSAGTNIGVTAPTNAGSYRLRAVLRNGSSTTIGEVNYAFTINPAPLVFSWPSSSRPYSGVEQTHEPTVSGLLGASQASVVSFANTKATNVGSYTASATIQNSNYALPSNSSQAWNITRATLSVVAGNQSRQYGDANPAPSLTVTGLVNGEQASTVLTGWGTHGATTNATVTDLPGTYTITVNSLTSGNYEISTTNAQLTIERRSISVTWHKPGNGYALYTGVPQTVTASSTNLVNGDSILLSGNTETNAGGYTASIIQTTLTRYNVVMGNTSETWSIFPAPLTIRANNVTTDYGSFNASMLGYTASGFVNGETVSVLSGSISYAHDATTTTVAGSQRVVTPSGFSSNNYDISFPTGTITITKRVVGLQWNGHTGLTYIGGPVSVTATVTNPANGETITTTVSGGSAINAGTYTAKVIDLSDRNNYEIPSVDEISYVINRASLSIQANPAGSRQYGNPNPVLQYSVSGLVGGQTIESVETATNSKLVISTVADARSVPGTYPVTVSGLTSDNYDILFSGSTITVNKRNLNVTWLLPQNAIYSNEDKTVSISGATVNGDIIQLVNASARNAGTHTTTISAETTNLYEISVFDLSVTWNIAPMALTVRADNIAMVYGGTPSFSYGFSPFAQGENASVLSGTLNARLAETGHLNVAEYEIIVDGVSSPNYDIAFVGGTLTVTKFTLTVSFSGFETAVYSGVKFNPVALPLAAAYGEVVSFVTQEQNDFRNVGTHTLTVTGFNAPSNDNYQLAVSGLTETKIITPASLQVIAKNISRVYGEANPSLSISNVIFRTSIGDSLLGEDTYQDLGGTLNIQILSANEQSAVGDSYVISIGGFTSDNYNISFVNGALSITRRAVSFSKTAFSRAFDASGYIVLNDYEMLGVTAWDNSKDSAGIYNVLQGAYQFKNPAGDNITAVGFRNAGIYTVNLSDETVANYSFGNVVLTYVIEAITIDIAIGSTSNSANYTGAVITRLLTALSYEVYLNGNIVEGNLRTYVAGYFAGVTVTASDENGVQAVNAGNYFWSLQAGANQSQNFNFALDIGSFPIEILRLLLSINYSGTFALTYDELGALNDFSVFNGGANVTNLPAGAEVRSTVEVNLERIGAGTLGDVGDYFASINYLSAQRNYDIDNIEAIGSYLLLANGNRLVVQIRPRQLTLNLSRLANLQNEYGSMRASSVDLDFESMTIAEINALNLFGEQLVVGETDNRLIRLGLTLRNGFGVSVPLNDEYLNADSYTLAYVANSAGFASVNYVVASAVPQYVFEVTKKNLPVSINFFGGGAVNSGAVINYTAGGNDFSSASAYVLHANASDFVKPSEALGLITLSVTQLQFISGVGYEFRIDFNKENDFDNNPYAMLNGLASNYEVADLSVTLTMRRANVLAEIELSKLYSLSDYTVESVSTDTLDINDIDELGRAFAVNRAEANFASKGLIFQPNGGVNLNELTVNSYNDLFALSLNENSVYYNATYVITLNVAPFTVENFSIDISIGESERVEYLASFSAFQGGITEEINSVLNSLFPDNAFIVNSFIASTQFGGFISNQPLSVGANAITVNVVGGNVLLDASSANISILIYISKILVQSSLTSSTQFVYSGEEFEVVASTQAFPVVSGVALTIDKDIRLNGAVASAVKNAGAYLVTLSLNTLANAYYELSETAFEIVVMPRALSLAEATGNAVVYDGLSKHYIASFLFKDAQGNGFTVADLEKYFFRSDDLSTQVVPVNAGEYVVNLVVNDSNFEMPSAGLSAVFVIARAMYTEDFLQAELLFNNATRVYNGEITTPVITNLPNAHGLSFVADLGGKEIRGAGSFVVSFTVSSPNTIHPFVVSGITFTISRAEAVLDESDAPNGKTFQFSAKENGIGALTQTLKAFAFDGGEEISSDLIFVYFRNGNEIPVSQVRNVGTYSVEVRLQNPNSELTEVYAYSFDIHAREVELKEEFISELSFNGGNANINLFAQYDEDYKVIPHMIFMRETYVNAGNPAPKNASGGAFGISVPSGYEIVENASGAGKYIVVISFEDEFGNYSYDGETMFHFEIFKAILTASIAGLEHKYSGTAKQATYNILGLFGNDIENITVFTNYYKDGSEANPTLLGDYEFVLSIVADNYTFETVTTTLRITANAFNAIVVGDAEYVYDGNAKSPGAVNFGSQPQGFTQEGVSVYYSFIRMSDGLQLTTFPVNAGQYDVTAVIMHYGFEVARIGAILTINRAEFNIDIRVTRNEDGTIHVISTNAPAGTVYRLIDLEGNEIAPGQSSNVFNGISANQAFVVEVLFAGENFDSENYIPVRSISVGGLRIPEMPEYMNYVLGFAIGGVALLIILFFFSMIFKRKDRTHAGRRYSRSPRR